MIVIYEPLCKKFSHEKINSGFIYSFRKAFPGEKICFYAHVSHLKAIKSIFTNDKIRVNDIVYKHLTISGSVNLFSFVINTYNLLKIRKELLSHSEFKVFLTSHNSLILYIIKTFRVFRPIKFYLVLHGSFEEINTGELTIESNQVLKYQIPKKTIVKRLSGLSLRKVIFYFGYLTMKVSKLFSVFSYFYSRKYNTGEVIKYGSNDNIVYIVVSEHIIKNVEKIMEFKGLSLRYHFYPNVFFKSTLRPQNKTVKFGVFGYGDPVVLYNVAKVLESCDIREDFVIRVIGMDNTVSTFFPFIENPSNGLSLTRNQMEDLVSDIDVLLILYSNQKYRLSCSATIVEALSYCKPIIHFKNDCISYYNSSDLPIGFEANSIDEFVSYMVRAINDFESFKSEVSVFRKNIKSLRKTYSIECHYNNLAQIFSE